MKWKSFIKKRKWAGRNGDFFRNGEFMRTQKEIDDRNKEVEKKIHDKKYDKNIYHYTSMGALLGILNNQELWLGNTANMNDKSEIIDFIRKLDDAIGSDISPDKMNECNAFFDKLYKRLENEYPFAFCFSKLSDNAAQWERYADDARGGCIVFNTLAFMKLVYYSGALFHEVFYEYDIRKHAHYKILKKYFDTGVMEQLETETGEMDNILGCAYLHKHESFCTESEIRLTNLWNKKIEKSEFAFEMINGRLKKVLKLSLKELCLEENIDFEDLIDGIIIGPRSEQNERELREYLEYLGYKKLSNKVFKSQCPLR